jgi:hypothetical protein
MLNAILYKRIIRYLQIYIASLVVGCNAKVITEKNLQQTLNVNGFNFSFYFCPLVC